MLGQRLGHAGATPEGKQDVLNSPGQDNGGLAVDDVVVPIIGNELFFATG